MNFLFVESLNKGIVDQLADISRLNTQQNTKRYDLRSFKDDQADMAAFFSACFLFLAGSPVNVQPANSTVQVKTGKCPRPDLEVVYVGKDAPTLCETSCNRFLYTPVSSCSSQNLQVKHLSQRESLKVAYNYQITLTINLIMKFVCNKTFDFITKSTHPRVLRMNIFPFL